jgi:integrase
MQGTISHPGRAALREFDPAYVSVTTGEPHRSMGVRLCSTAKMPFRIHPLMLRHACGYKLANDGHDTRALATLPRHKNIQHTVRYQSTDIITAKNP